LIWLKFSFVSIKEVIIFYSKLFAIEPRTLVGIRF